MHTITMSCSSRAERAMEELWMPAMSHHSLQDESEADSPKAKKRPKAGGAQRTSSRRGAGEEQQFVVAVDAACCILLYLVVLKFFLFYGWLSPIKITWLYSTHASSSPSILAFGTGGTTGFPPDGQWEGRRSSTPQVFVCVLLRYLLKRLKNQQIMLFKHLYVTVYHITLYHHIHLQNPAEGRARKKQCHVVYQRLLRSWGLAKSRW